MRQDEEVAAAAKETPPGDRMGKKKKFGHGQYADKPMRKGACNGHFSGPLWS